MNTTFHPIQTIGDDEEDEKAVINSFNLNSHHLASIKNHGSIMGTWISQEPNNKVTNKNLSICWEKQIINTDENMIKF